MLLFKRRFLPFFITQFFGAFTDNIYKTALLVYLTLHIEDSQTLSLYTNLSAALFILPMVFFSAWSGVLADRFEKHFLIVRIKVLEVAIMVIGIAAFIYHLIGLMIAVLFLLGLQSTFFGPVKYGILPERLSDDELMLGNGLVEAGTFIAILTGTLAGSYLVGRHTMDTLLFAVMASATLIGLIAACFIPARRDMTNPQRLPPFQPVRQLASLLRYTCKQSTIFRCILAISWFWLIGGALLTQIPQYAKEVLHSNPEVTTYLLVLFSVGIAAGSLVANLLSHGRIEAGLVPVGAFVLAAGLWGLVGITGGNSTAELFDFARFCQSRHFFAVTLSFLAIAFGGGIYVVPLYAMIQQRAEAGYKSQMIAANNIINSLFLVLVSVIALVLLAKYRWTLQNLFLLLLILHLGISVYIFTVVPEFIMRCLVIVLTAFCYRIRVQGIDRIPRRGAAIIISNHVSYMDALILMAVIRRPVRFVMYHTIFHAPVLRYIFRTGRAIPIAPRHENSKIFRQAFADIHEALVHEEVVGIFPEGSITPDGELGEYKRGIEIMLNRDAVPVIPIAIGNLWGSFFSRSGGLFRGLPRKWFARIPVIIGEPLPPETTAARMREVTAELLAEAEKALKR